MQPLMQLLEVLGVDMPENAWGPRRAIDGIPCRFVREVELVREAPGHVRVADMAIRTQMATEDRPRQVFGDRAYERRFLIGPAA